MLHGGRGTLALIAADVDGGELVRVLLSWTHVFVAKSGYFERFRRDFRAISVHEISGEIPLAVGVPVEVDRHGDDSESST